MTADERQEIAVLLEARSFAPGETILEEGQSFQFIWVILSGSCHVVKAGRDDEERQLTVLEPAGVFGEMSFFSPAPHSASVRAASRVDVVRLAREKYDMLLRLGSLAAYKLAFNTMSVLIDRLRKMDDWVCDHMAGSELRGQREEWADFQSKLFTGWQF
jgi:CRP-like cAMP-binding protein